METITESLIRYADKIEEVFHSALMPSVSPLHPLEELLSQTNMRAHELEKWLAENSKHEVVVNVIYFLLLLLFFLILIFD